MRRADVRPGHGFWIKCGISGTAVVLVLLLFLYLSNVLKEAIAPPEGWKSQAEEVCNEQADVQAQVVYTPEEQVRADFRMAEREAAQKAVERREALNAIEQRASEQRALEQQALAGAWEPGDSPSTVEGAFGVLFEEIFAPLGDTYECRYNAKGNWYMVLSSGTVLLEGETGERDTVRTLVYDRESKNGECWLIVYYEEILNGDGSEYGTAIRNTYAVNKTEGDVIPSGKRAWEDVGNAEYQQATGEK